MDNKEKTVPMWKVKAQIKVKQAKDGVRRAGRAAKTYFYQHPEQAVGVVVAVLGAGKFVIREKRRYDDRRAVECRVYDRRADAYYTARRPLKNAERLMLDHRYMDNKENKGDILASMGLLKY